MRKPILHFLLSLTALTTYNLAACAANDLPTYQNMFISYYSPNNVTSMAEYIKENNLGGMIIWELRGDAPYGSPQSLLSAFNNTISGYQPPLNEPLLVMGYWDDWGVYSDDPDTRAIPEASYAIPGSLSPAGKPVSQTSTQDLNDKLEGINTIAYAFLEAQTATYTYYDNNQKQFVTIANQTPEDIGTLVFNDAWSDLQIPGQNTKQDKLCGSTATAKSTSKICWYGLHNRHTPIVPRDGAMMGNFNAFAKLRHANTSSSLGPLKKVISVGGYGHDNSFEETFTNNHTMTNFVNSAAAIINTFNLDGIDLDYENPKMTQKQSQQYLTLIEKLREKLPNKIITITILSDPNYLKGKRDGSFGFAPGVLQEIEQHADKINLMTYDFHGAYDYAVDGSGTTGLLTNLYLPNNAPNNYRFSVHSSVTTLIDQGIASEKIVVGIPAYGRALANINPYNGGLYQYLTTETTIPQGDNDTKSCSTAITPLRANSCDGMFTYRYIIDQLLPNGFIAMEQNDTPYSAISNATTAFASSWTQPKLAGYNIKITNSAASSIGFNLSLGEIAAPGFFNIGTTKTFTPPITLPISNQSITIQWETTWGPQGHCHPYLIDQDTLVSIEVTPNTQNNGFVTKCTFSQLTA